MSKDYLGERPQVEKPTSQHIGYLQSIRERQLQYNNRLENILDRLEGPIPQTTGKPAAPTPEPGAIISCLARLTNDISEIQNHTNILVDRLDSII
jgi:hypothetical protein